jgi:hypothetical protein
METLLEAVFSMWSAPSLYHLTNRVELVQWSGASCLVSQLEDRCGLVVVSCCCENLVAEALGQFGNPK